MSHLKKRHVLLVDDDKDMRDVLVDALVENGYQATAVADGKRMWEVLTEVDCDLIMMDLRLKQENGLQLAREIRRNSTLPIMMLTGKGDETDRILGLELAADDYLMKPFNIRELLARVHALLRRSTQLSRTFAEPVHEDHDCYLFGDWVLDATSRELKDNEGKRIDLTFLEFNLLLTLVKAPDQVFSREQLLDKTRSTAADVFDRTIDVAILRLRRKIEPTPKHPRYILTERSIGYFFSGPVKVGR